MLRFTHLAKSGVAEPSLSLSLSHEQRRRSRVRVRLADATEVGIFLARGLMLRDGDVLVSEDDAVTARVRAASEHVSVAETPDTHLLSRAAYHLGNRHVPLQLQPGRLIYPHDHVLDGMCRELGLEVTQKLLPFEPEAGGYAGGHSHVSIESREKSNGG